METILTLFLTLAVSIIDLVAFSVILYLIEPKLFLCIVVFNACGTAVTKGIGKWLVWLNFDQLSLKANFRYSLVQVRDHAKCIAFFHGEEQEAQTIQQQFLHAIANTFELNWTNEIWIVYLTVQNYTTWILPLVVIASQYFQGMVELGVI